MPALNRHDIWSLEKKQEYFYRVQEVAYMYTRRRLKLTFQAINHNFFPDLNKSLTNQTKAEFMPALNSKMRKENQNIS